MINFVSKFISFFRTDVWQIRLEELPSAKSFFLKQLRIFLLAIRGFNEDRCYLRASALTFYSLLSVVPVLAMIFGVSRGFGSEKLVEKQLLDKFPGQEEVVMQIIAFANSLLEETRGGMLAGIGVAVLFWAVIKLLSHIERSFNDIWKIREPRSLLKKMSDYLSVTLICPILVIVASSATVFIATQISVTTERSALLGIFSPVISLILKILPYGVFWGVFAFIFIFMPNTKVRFKPAFIAGVITGTAYQVAQWGYINFQVGVAQYNAIYGSFAALPLFLFWLQLSWLIVLFGAEVSYRLQNVDVYDFAPDCLKVSNSFNKLISLLIAHLLIKNFADGSKPLTRIKISHALKIPLRLVIKITDELVESGIASEIKVNKKEEFGYQPARDINILTMKYIIDALDHRGFDDIPIEQTKEIEALSESLKTFGNTIEKSPANKLLRDI